MFGDGLVIDAPVRSPDTAAVLPPDADDGPGVVAAVVVPAAGVVVAGVAAFGLGFGFGLGFFFAI
jgi:hypothetical protein